MARHQAKSNIKSKRGEPPTPKDQGKRQALRKSLRLQAIRQSHKQSLSKRNHPHPPPSNFPKDKEVPQPPQILHKLSTSSRKRKRGQEEQEAAHLSPQIPEQHPSEKERKKESASDIIEETADPLKYWTVTKRWPKEYFEQDSQVREDFEQGSQIREDFEEHSWLEEQMEYPANKIRYVEINGFWLPCPIRRLPTSLRRKQSDSSLNGSSDQTNREQKSAPYRTSRYTILLEGKGSYMYESELGITEGSKDLYQRLLQSEQAVPHDTLFRDDLFKKTCRKIDDRNEARVVQDIARLIVPSAETLATFGATQLDHLIEGVNECWTGNIAVEGPLPRPDYSVGFRRSAFTNQQLKKLDPLIGSVFETSLFVANYRMYFPFFTCEVKCGASALDVADRQNAHSMTVALRAFIELFRSVRREKELNREILAFSVSHDHRSVRIYGHYPIIKDDKITFYRHAIRTFDFTEQDGREKWTTLKLVKNIYDDYSPKVHKLICSAIDDLPDEINFDLSQSASFSHLPSTPQRSQQSNADSISGGDDTQSSFLASQEVTPPTSFTQAMEPASKRPRNQRGG